MAKTIECPKCKNTQALDKEKLDSQGRFVCQSCGAKIHVRRKAVAATMAHVVEDADLDAEPTSTEAVKFKQSEGPDEEMDLTPMVDVTFLLLIFFMVTASFSMQKSLDLPAADPADSAQQSRTVVDIENEDDNVIIRVDGDNSLWVNDDPAPSDQEMIARLRELREGTGTTSGVGPSKLLIIYHPESQVQYAVRAHDAGTAVGMESIEWRMSAEDW